MPSPLPVTLVSACVMTLFYLALCARVSRGRMRYHVSLGDGGNQDLLARMRAHANFIEYVPLSLILMGVLETASTNPIVLAAGGGLLFLFRVLHVVGIPRPAPNIFRFIGASGTYLLLLAASIWGLVLVFVA
ncbi:MAG: glutathione S-transferase [Rhodospirillaceae bacterium]|nr:glutathione S-transferase [Rhodospirillaceae bacterium]